MKEVVYFSYTGNSEKIAEAFASKLNCRVVEIKSSRNRSYFGWLLLSFIPGFGVGVSHERVEGDEIVLCFPKWTFNCPPVTSFIKSGKLRGKRIFIIVVCGGWRPENYTSKYAQIVEKYGGKVVGWRIIKKKYLNEVLNSEELLEEVERAFSHTKRN